MKRFITDPAFDPLAFELRKRQLQTMMDEYEVEIAAYDTWLKGWRARQPKGFKAKRGPDRQEGAA